MSLYSRPRNEVDDESSFDRRDVTRKILTADFHSCFSSLAKKHAITELIITGFLNKLIITYRIFLSHDGILSFCVGSVNTHNLLYDVRSDLMITIKSCNFYDERFQGK